MCKDCKYDHAGRQFVIDNVHQLLSEVSEIAVRENGGEEATNEAINKMVRRLIRILPREAKKARVGSATLLIALQEVIIFNIIQNLPETLEETPPHNPTVN